MKVLIIGGGGREHALAWKAAQSPQVSEVFVAPGNAGTEGEDKVRNLPIAAENIPRLLRFASENKIELTIVGPEAPLAEGVVDSFREHGLRIFGPTRAAAQLEASKSYTKDFLARYNIASGAYQSFTELQPALEYIRAQGAPIVIKADGLAAGKGVVLAETVADAERAATEMLGEDSFGAAGRSIVVEEFLFGEEASFICMVDGSHILALASSQDHKARDEGDRGPNTGGMGAYSPAPVVTEALHQRVMTEVIEPTVRGMAEDGNPYTGFLYAGLMIDDAGNPKVLEYNCRFGDPETQPILMRLKSDLVALCEDAVEGTLDTATAEWDSRVALGVVLSAGGYPRSYRKGDAIQGLEQITTPGTKVFHAGTTLNNGDVVTDGGRVLCVCALGETVEDAQTNAYREVDKIWWDGVYFRRDIGHRAVGRK